MAGLKNSGADRPDTDQGGQESFGRGRYKDKSLEELIDMLDELVLEIKSRKSEITQVISRVPKPEFPSEASGSEATHFVRLPRSTSNLLPEATAVNWRIVLQSSDHRHKPLNLEIYDDIIVGRTQEYIVPDLDLTEYDALERGVSRQHALLHPTEDSLELVDLLSSNGTFVNDVRLKKGENCLLKDGDVLSFGLMHFKLTIVGQPGSPRVENEAQS